MFMTNYELIYGEYKGTSGNSSSPVHREQPAPHKEKGKGTETAVKAAKAVVGAHIAAAKFAGGAVSKLSKKAVDYAKSDDAAEKAAFAKEKAGAAFAGLKGKAAALAADRKKAVGGDTLDDDVIADENFPVEEAYSESDIVRDTADYNEEVSDAESFDELYKKAMDSFDDEESYDEAASLETDTEDGYNEETVNEVKEPVDTPSVDPSPAPPTSTQPKPAPRQFSYEEEKKSPVVFVLVGVIAVLLIGMGILGGMLLMKNKDDKSDNSKSDNAQSTTDSSTSANLEVKSSDIEKAANSVLLEMDERGMDIKGYYILSSDVTINANLPNDNFDIDFFYNDIPYFFEEADSYEWFVLAENGHVESAAIGDSWDNNAFGSNETLQSLLEQAMERVYQYNNNNATTAETTTETVTTTIPETTTEQIQEVTISPSDPYAAIKQEIIESVDNEHYSGKNSHIENAPADMRFYNMSERYNMNVSSPTVYEGPGTDYSKIEVYSDFFWVYGENSDWYYVEWGEGNGAFSHCCYGYMSKSSNNNSAAKYTEYDTSAAGNDFEFYSDYFVGCKVATQSGTLNLRAAPSTTAEVIIQMPKDAYVQVLGNNADWDYLSYTDNGTTYYGYASREYIK